MKYQNRLAGKVTEKKEFQDKQKKLKKKYAKYRFEDGIIHIEKKRLLEVFVKTFSALLRTLISIIIIALATVGGLSLLYPATRQEMQMVLIGIYRQAIQLIGA